MAASAGLDDTTLLCLRAGEFLPLRGAPGRSVAVIRGRLWIAQDDGQHEAFVGRGRTFALDRPGGATLHALEPSSLRLQERAAAPPRAHWRQRLERAARRWVGALRRPTAGSSTHASLHRQEQ